MRRKVLALAVLAAACAAEAREPETLEWVGGDGGDWNTPENWSPAFVPEAGDTVVLDASAATTVALGSSTPHLARLVVSNYSAKATTLVLSGWETKIDADEVVVGKGGVITCAGPFADADMSNRVWIVAGNLDILAGGKIDVNEKGYSYLNGPCWTAEVRASSSWAAIAKHCGGAYGGRQGYDNMLTKSYDGYFKVAPEPQPYGDPAAPLDPGSGAGTNGSGLNGCAGGGAVRLEVSGRLTVDGVVTANGGPIRGGVYGGSSGGGIYVTCQTIAGAGSITANGGGVVGVTVQGGGSGGRVAVVYDAESQRSTDCRVRFEARSGCNHNNNRASGIREPGTLYFTDNQFLTSSAYLANGWKFAGRWMSAAGTPTSLAIDGDLTLDHAQLAFTEKPLDLDVTGNLVMKGSLETADISWFSNATITVGGDLKIDSNRLELYGGSLSVAGNMLLQTNGTTRCGSELVVRAAATNGVDRAYGATVNVDGTVTLGNNAMISPWAEEKNGAVVNFTFGDFVLDAGASVDANEKGYRSGYGPGKPTAASDNAGASHGGKGGSIADMAHVAPVCDSEEHPVQPGSSANRESGATAQSWHGGGAVLISVSRTMTLNGTISANGNANIQFWYPGTAGGTVNLKAPIVRGTTGAITAKGGNRNDWDKGSYGGGGRIAVGYRQNQMDGVTMSAASLNTEYAEDGTVYTYMLPPQPDTFTVSAVPEEVGGEAINPGYGDNLALAPGTEILCTASTEPIDLGDAVGVIRGWKLYLCDAKDNRTLVDEATTNAYRYVHAAGTIYRLEWQIVRTYAVTLVQNEATGADVYAGGQKLSVGVNYVPESDAVIFRAEPKAGYSVFCWSGADFADTQASSVTLPVKGARTLSLVLTDANHEPGTVTWTASAGGKWTDLSKWANGAFPQAGDAVTIASSSAQTITLGVSTPRLGRLEIGGAGSGSAKLLLSGWTTCVNADAIVVGSGGTVAVEGAFTDEQPSNRVYLAGGTLTVAAGGKILADKAGYAKRNGPAWVGATREKNHASANGQRNEFGGAYGGEQAYPIRNGRVADSVLVPPHAYGSVTAPLDPGSGGGEYAGGGAIRLDFSGAVTIDGLVSAAGETGALNTGGPGSGGAVFITCSTIAGSGEVKANGRDAAVNAAVNNYGGAGGRVAVVYDPSAQDSADCRVRFEARGGLTHTLKGDAANGSPTAFVPDVISEDGTLYFPDSRFLTTGSYRENGLKFAGQWKAPLDGDVLDFGDDDLFLDRTHLVLPAGVAFVAGGNVTMAGFGPRPAENGLVVSNASVTVGGNLVLKDARVELRCGDLAVGGDLVQEANDGVTYADNDYWARKTGGGELCFHPAPTNEIAGVIGARLTVGGNWTMSAGAATYPFSHPTDGSIVAMQVEGDFTLTAEAYVVGDMRGYAGFNGPGRKPGQNSVGASHGGKGSYSTADPNMASKVAAVYGNFRRPLTPGTGAAGSDDYGITPAPGGSAIYLVAGGCMTLNGYIGACGTTENFFRYWQAASSGGSIFLKAGRLKDGAPTVIAKGGKGDKGGYSNGIGGGGRIAVHYAMHDIADFEAYKACFAAPKGDVGAGTAVSTAEDGTVYWHQFGGFSVIVR